MSDTPAPKDSVTVVYTGTRAPEGVDGLRIEHLPMLQKLAVDFDLKKVRILVRQPCTLVFYSQNSLKTVADSGLLDGIDLTAHTIWAVGQKTADAVFYEFGVDARVPDDERFEGLVSEFRKTPPPPPIVAFTLEDSPRTLAEQFDGRSRVHEIPVYQTCPVLYPRLCDTLAEIDARWVAFTSPRGVSTFLTQASGCDLSALHFAAIGPTTAEALAERGVDVDLVMQTPDKNAMMRQILDASTSS